MTRTPQRARITRCPHGGKHDGVDGYIVDTYSDGTVAIDMGFNHTCITPGWEELPPVKREEVRPNSPDESSAENTDFPIAPPKRRGRPPKKKLLNSEIPIQQSPLERLMDDVEADLKEMRKHERKSKVQTKPQPLYPVLSVATINGDRVTLSFRSGETVIEATNATANDLAALSDIISALTN